jgi:hypothetical protein
MDGDEGGIHYGGGNGAMDWVMQSFFFFFFFYHNGPNFVESNNSF